MSVMHMYMPVQNPIHDMATLKTVSLILKRYTARPAKKRERERCNNVGNASTAHGR